MQVKLSPKIKQEARKMTGMISDLKKKLFELEVMHAEWEAMHSPQKEITSGKEYVNSILKRA